MTEPAWYVSIQQESYGPVTLEELQQWLKEGRFQITDYVFGPGFSDWTPAGEIESFQEPGSPEPLSDPGEAVPVSEPVSSEDATPEETKTSPHADTPISNKKENDHSSKKSDNNITKPRRKSLIIITLILVLIIAGGIAGYLFSKGDSDSVGNSNPYLNSVDLGKPDAAPSK